MPSLNRKPSPLHSMKTDAPFTLSLLGALMLLLLLLATPGALQALTISDLPLFISTEVRPNILLMLDNSGSMQNIVPDSPYNSREVYLTSCPGSNAISTGTQVEVRVVNGTPRIRYDKTNYFIRRRFRATLLRPRGRLQGQTVCRRRQRRQYHQLSGSPIYGKLSQLVFQHRHRSRHRLLQQLVFRPQTLHQEPHDDRQKRRQKPD